jgi:hypothetical protein
MTVNFQTSGNATIDRYFEVGTLYRRYLERNGLETARTKYLYGLDDGSGVWRCVHQDHEPSSSPYTCRSLVRAVFSAVLRPNGGPMLGPISFKVSRFRRETLHGRLKERMQPSENDRVLKNGLSTSKPDYFSHSGPQGAEGGHHEEVGLGVAELVTWA